MQVFRIFGRKLKQIFQKNRQQGDNFFWTLFRTLINSILILWAGLINKYILNKLSNYPRFSKFQRQHRHQLGNHFYIIVVPNKLHLLNPCLKLIPSHIRVFLIFNGIQKWEAEYIQENYPHHPAFKLSTHPGSCISHGAVLTLLLKGNHKNFGIIDHDLYIFNETVFEELDFEPNECVIGVFQIENQTAGLIFPTTHFMFFHTALIRAVMDKYRVDANIYRWIPLRIRPLLAQLNLGYHNRLKSYLLFFDTFNMIQALAFYEGFSVKFVDNVSGLWHVGGVSYIKNSAYLNYIQLKFLEMPINTEILPHYSKLFVQKESIHKALEDSFQKEILDRKMVLMIELAIKKIGEKVQDLSQQ